VTDSRQGLIDRVAELREAFDRSFAVPVAQSAETGQTFLILGVGTARYAAALDGLLGIEHGRKIVPLPVRAAGLLGLAGFRGQLAPVFSLASLLGRPDGPERPAWMAFCKGPTPVAIAFDRFEGSVLVPSRDIYGAEPDASASRPGRRRVRLGSGTLSVVDVPSVVEAARRSLDGRGSMRVPTDGAV
jgi:purine-binding chemotaxis protein CheW